MWYGEALRLNVLNFDESVPTSSSPLGAMILLPPCFHLSWDGLFYLVLKKSLRPPKIEAIY